MQEIQKFLDVFWEDWTAVEKLGEGTFGKVYKIRREFLGREQFAALKVISVSQNKTGCGYSFSMDDKSFVEEIVSEIELMAKFKGNSNIVSYEDHMVIEESDGSGWTILIRMELLTPLSAYIQQNDVTEETVVKLGKDISKALDILSKNNIIHRDIKLENIFISDNGDFKLGDFGTARIIEKTVDNRTKTGTYMYMAPEVIRSEPYGVQADIYSLGILMYYLLNDFRFPFYPQYPEPVKYDDTRTAFNKRISGEAMTPPKCENKKLASIVLKACEFRSENRFANTHDMNIVLETVYAEGTAVLLDSYLGEIDSEFEEKNTDINKTDESVGKEPTVQKLKNKKFILPVIIVGAVLIIAVIAAIFSGETDNSENKDTDYTTLSSIETHETAEPDDTVEIIHGTLKYKAYDDGIHITGLTEECETLEIPAEIEGKPVVAIASEAFSNRLFTAVNLPDTLKKIGDYAFINCANLGEISLPEGIKSIGERAFEKCFSLVTVNLPESLETIGNMAFMDCIKLFNISVPSGIKNVGKDIFEYTPYIKNRKIMLDRFKECLAGFSDSKYTLLDIDGNGVEELLVFGVAQDEVTFSNYHMYQLAVYDYEYEVTKVDSSEYVNSEFYIGVPIFTVPSVTTSIRKIYNDYDILYHNPSEKCLYGCANKEGFETIYKIARTDRNFTETLYKESAFVGSNPTVLGEEIVFESDINDTKLLEEVVMRGIA